MKCKKSYPIKLNRLMLHTFGSSHGVAGGLPPLLASTLVPMMKKCALDINDIPWLGQIRLQN